MGLSKAFVLFLYCVGAFPSICKPCYSAREVASLSFTLGIVTVTETPSDAFEILLEEQSVILAKACLFL